MIISLCVACYAAWHNDVVVGGVCCRFEAVAAPASASAADTDDKNNKASEVSHSAQAQNRIYIMTLGVLAPYRGRGIGRRAKRHCEQGLRAAADLALPLPALRSAHSCTRVAFGFSVDFPGGKLLRQILEYAESHSDIADVFLHVRRHNDHTAARVACLSACCLLLRFGARSLVAPHARLILPSLRLLLLLVAVSALIPLLLCSGSDQQHGGDRFLQEAGIRGDGQARQLLQEDRAAALLRAQQKIRARQHGKCKRRGTRLNIDEHDHASLALQPARSALAHSADVDALICPVARHVMISKIPGAHCFKQALICDLICCRPCNCVLALALGC